MKPETEPLRTEYAQLAARYDVRWRRYVERSTAATLARMAVAPGSRVLDVGCGTGVLLEHLADQGGLYLAGIDPVAEMLGVARRRLAGTARLAQAWAEALPFADTSVDAIVSTSAFHFVRTPSAALRECRRVLRPGGQLVLTDWCADFATMRLLDWTLRWTHPAHNRVYDLPTTAHTLEAAGFDIRALDRYRIDWFWGLSTATAVKP